MIARYLRVLFIVALCGFLLPVLAQGPEPTQPPPPIVVPEITIPTPPTTPTLSTPTVTLPPVDEPLRPGTVRVYAERILFSDALGLAEFFGNVTLETERVTIHADEASYNRETDLAVARGIVSIRAEDGITYWGSALEYNARTRDWHFLDYSVEYPPPYLGAQFVAPVFVQGQELSGLPSGIRAANSRVTTCDLPNPHYYLISRRVDIYPQDKLIAYDNDFYLLGHRVLHIPWFFLSLKQHRSPIVPEVGRNEEEGYYMRLLYQYVLTPNQLGGIRLDLTSRLGPGLGIDHFYTLPSGYGEAFVYARQGFTEYVTRWDHTQQLPANTILDLSTDIRQNSRFTLQPTTSTNINANLHRTTEHTNTFLNYTRRLDKSEFLTDNASANLRYDLNRNWGNLHYSGEYNSSGFPNSSSSNTPPDQKLWNRLQVMRHLGFGDLNLRIDHRTDLGGPVVVGDNPFIGVERVPEVYLETSQSQMKWDYLTQLPSRFTVGWGEYNEHAHGSALSRYLFNWQANTAKPICFGHTELLPTFNFRQTSYGDKDNTAYYYFNAGLNARTTFGPTTTNVLTYGKQDAHGFTPFSFDTIYPYETISDSLQYLTPRLRLYLTNGRDLLHGRWQDSAFRMDQQVTQNFAQHQMVGYNFNNGTWDDLVSQFSYQQEPRLIFNLGSRYDMEGGKLRRVSTELDWVITPVWRLQWLGGYDNTTQTTLYNEFLLIRDLHCWDVALYSSLQQHYVYLYVRLKALNLPLPFFGIGRGGQVLDTNQGVPF